MNITQLDELYKLYKFNILPISDNDIRVYSFINKYFSNADIIVFNKKAFRKLTVIKKQLEDLGFSATVRDYKSLKEAENNLFDGFFDIEKSNKLLSSSYQEYSQKVESLIFGKYEFIDFEYDDVENNITRKGDIIETLLSNLKENGPVLILLEAAAGFGKTSTSYELVNVLSKEPNTRKIPLFTELSRNRQASIFKYVLYDEINSRFTGLSLELVIKHIIDGRIPLIIDGFDELLKPKSKENSEDRFEDAEPMLETIKELLKGEAKIMLTSRRTAIFSEDDFFEWLSKNNEFKFFRYNISEPDISDWIPTTREKLLRKAGLNLRSISNPVLLAYLRSMDDDSFKKGVDNIDKIIDDYFSKLMDRENERQDLNMTIEEQKDILGTISSYFTDNDITSESKDILEKLLIEKEQKLFINVINRFAAERKPTLDQLINKLIIHAFLDRKGEDRNQIGFVNDFILGSFIGNNLLEERELWFGTERFIDFMLSSYIPRNDKTKKNIYEILHKEIINYLNVQKQIFIDIYLFGRINRDIQNEYFTNLEFRNHFDNGVKINECTFSNCELYQIDFDHQLTNSFELYFINCKFFDCNLTKDVIQEKKLNFISCVFSPENKNIQTQYKPIIEVSHDDVEINYEKKVLERFWQSGKEIFIPNKRLTTLRLGIPPEEIPFIDDAIESLIKKGYIIKRRGQHSLQLNIKHLSEIKTILGR